MELKFVLSYLYWIWKIVSLIFCLKILKNKIVIKYKFLTILRAISIF